MAGVLVAVGVMLLAARPAATVEQATVVTAMTNLPAGHLVQKGDVALTAVPVAAVVPGNATDLDSVIGRVTAAPLVAGEPIADRRLVGPSLVAAMNDSGDDPANPVVITTVDLADSSSAALARHGDLVDIISAHRSSDLSSDKQHQATVVASAARVVALVEPDSASSLGESVGNFGSATPRANRSGSLLLVAVPRSVAAELMAAGVDQKLAIVVRARP